MSTVIPEIVAFSLRRKKKYTSDMHLRQLKRNKEVMLQKLSELKGEDFDRCKWTINNYTKQIKELEEG